MSELEGSIQLTWDQFQKNNAGHFKEVQSSKDFTDVTLVTEDGITTESHRIILAAGSQFFQRIFLHPRVGELEADAVQLGVVSVGVHEELLPVSQGHLGVQLSCRIHHLKQIIVGLLYFHDQDLEVKS